MEETTARFLAETDEGRCLLEEVGGALAGGGKDAAPAALLSLRKRGVPAKAASGAVAVAEARRRGKGRYPDAERLFFTPDALAQATSPGIAAYHAAGFASFERAADLCCGVGMDAIAFAEAGMRSVVAVDIDPARIVFAQANATARGVADRITFVCADVRTYRWDEAGIQAVFWDPSRREEAGSGGSSRRVSAHADRYEPALSFLEEIRAAPGVRAVCVKLSPALPDEVLMELGGRIEFLSEGRECKEACIWLGEAQGAAGGDALRSAVLLPERIAVRADEDEEMPPLSRQIGAFIFDPDPALIRVGALGEASRLLGGASLISPEDSYLTGDAVADGTARLASAYRVVEAMPYQPRRVGEALQARDIGRLVVKKRRFPKEPDAVARELGLSGRGGKAANEATLIIVKTGKSSHLAVLCEPVT